MTDASAPSGAYAPERLHCEITGPADAPAVLVLHGWGSSAQLMRPLARALDDRFRVYNLDLPGHGHSPAPPEPWGVPEYAALVEAYRRETIGRPVSVVGHSNGGRISLYMTTEPGLAEGIERLALVSPSGITPTRGAKYHLKRSVATALKAPFQLLPGPLREAGLDWLRHSLVWRALGSSDYRALRGVMRDTFVRTVGFHIDDRLDRVRVPVLLFWGDRDTAVARDQMEKLERGIPDAGLVVLEGAGHYGYLDDLDQVAAGIRHFFGAEAVETSDAVGSSASG